MRFIHGIKFGGLQQKIFNLMLIFIVALAAVYLSVSLFQQRELSRVVEDASAKQQDSIAVVSFDAEGHMKLEACRPAGKFPSDLVFDRRGGMFLCEMKGDRVSCWTKKGDVYERTSAFPVKRAGCIVAAP